MDNQTNNQQMSLAVPKKRKQLEGEIEEQVNPKKGRKDHWNHQTSRRVQNSSGDNRTCIEVGDKGIWASCEMNKEAKCISELRDIFNQYATSMTIDTNEKTPRASGDQDIAVGIKNEVDELHNISKQESFQPVKIDAKCVIFFKVAAKIEPTALVHKLCMDAAQSPHRKKSRWVKRLTPMSMMGKATTKGVAEVAAIVLAPHFHGRNIGTKKFAIRTNIRNHTTLTRDAVIKQVAEAVGSEHTVDLTNYDLLVLVDIYKNVCGMSVVGNDYEKLKRYNIAEIYQPLSSLVTR